MRKRYKIVLALCGALLGAAVLGACTLNDNPYKDIKGKGFDVFVSFDPNGGLIASADGSALVDTYRSQDLQSGVKLLAPGDPARGRGASNSIVSREGYTLYGWYRTAAQARVDELGNKLDENGGLCIKTGNPQGYSYSGKWDFSADRLTMDDVTPEVHAGISGYGITLHAAWIPNYSYEFFAENEAGEWESYGTAVKPENAASIAVPAWNLETGQLVYGSVPRITGKTLEHIYASPDKTEEYLETIPHGGTVDDATATATNTVVPCYTTWREGNWFKISTAAQLNANLQADGCYEILQDLDFTANPTLFWNGGKLEFRGTILGGGHEIKGISTIQAGDFIAGGVFGRITADAKIENVKFEDVTLTITNATRLVGGLYGLLAGDVSSSAAITGVTLTGTIFAGDLIDERNFTNFTIGLVGGNLVTAGIATGGIRVHSLVVEVYDSASGGFVNTYPVLLEAEEDGSVRVTKNPDPLADPNPETDDIQGNHS